MPSAVTGSILANRVTASPMISKLRSTAWRKSRSDSKSFCFFPWVTWRMNALASRMSSRSLGDLGCIKSGPRPIHFANKIGILERRGEYQINRALKQHFELILEIEKMAQPGTEVLIGQEFHKEIQVAGILVPGPFRR